MDSIIIYDTEYTAWDGSFQRDWSEPWEHRELVQIGAVKLDLTHGFPETDCLSLLLQPQINPQLSEYFINLTGITQAAIETEGFLFPAALERFLQFAGNETPLISNHEDYLVLEENCQLHQTTLPVEKTRFLNANPFLSHYTNTKEVISSDLPSITGTTHAGKAHDALDDARAIAEAIRRISAANNLSPQEFPRHDLLLCWGV